jgi:hypothetical protein
MSALSLPRRKTLAVTAAVVGVAVLGLGATGAVAGVASADRASEKTGACGTARYDAEVDREDGGLESSFEIDDAQPGQRWHIKLSKNGDTYVDREFTTDREGEIDVERRHIDGPGVDEFVMSAQRLDGPGSCSVTLTR